MSQQEYDQAFAQRLKEYAYSQCSLTGEHEGLEVCSDKQRQNATDLSGKDSFNAEDQVTFLKGGLPDTKRAEEISFNDVDHSRNVLDPAIFGLGEEATDSKVYARLETLKGLKARTGKFFRDKEDIDLYHMVKDNVYYVYISDANLGSGRTLDDPEGNKSRTQSRLSQEILDYTAQDLIVKARWFKEVDGEIFEIDEYGNMEYYTYQTWEDVKHHLSTNGYLPFGTYGEPSSGSSQGLGI